MYGIIELPEWVEFWGQIAQEQVYLLCIISLLLGSTGNNSPTHKWSCSLLLLLLARNAFKFIMLWGQRTGGWQKWIKRKMESFALKTTGSPFSSRKIICSFVKSILLLLFGIIYRVECPTLLCVDKKNRGVRFRLFSFLCSAVIIITFMLFARSFVKSIVFFTPSGLQAISISGFSGATGEHHRLSGK